MFLGDTLQLQAVVNGTLDQQVIWWASEGSVDSSGLYRAPPMSQAGVDAYVSAWSPAIARRASLRIALKYRPPIIASLSGPAGPYETLTINGSGFSQAQVTTVAVLFPTTGSPIEVRGTALSDGQVTVTVPEGSISGPLVVGIPYDPPFPSTATATRVYSDPIAFVRMPRLRVHPDRIDLAAGESTRVRVTVLGRQDSVPLTFDADQGTFNGDTYVAAATVASISFDTIRVCVKGTSVCSGATVATHPFRIEPPFAVVPAGTNTNFSAVGGNGAANVTFSLLGPGQITPQGLFTAPSALTDSGPEQIVATDGVHVETGQVAPSGLVPGLVARIEDYIDHRVPSSTPDLPYGSAAEQIAIGGTRAYVLMRPAATSFTHTPTLYWIDVYDLTDPLRPAWVGAVESSTRPMAMSVSHGRLYAFSSYDSTAGFGRTIAVYDVAGPLPKLVRRVIASPQVGRVAVFKEPPVLDDDFLYVFGLATDDGVQPVDIYLLADGPLETPRTVSIPFPPATSSIAGFTAHAGRAYATFEQSEQGTVFPRLAAWDLSSNPAKLLGVTDAPSGIPFAGPPTFARQFLLASGCLYDTTSPLPRQVTCPQVGGSILAGDGNRFVTTDGELLDLSDPSTVRPAGRASLAGATGGFSGGYLFVAQSVAGIGIYDVHPDGGPIFKGPSSFTAPYVFPEPSAGLIRGSLFYAGGLALDELNDLGWAFVGVWDLQSSPPSFVWQEPTGSASCSPSCGATAMAATDNSLLVGRIDALEVRSLAAPRSPTIVSQLSIGVSAIGTSGNLAWIGTQDGHLKSLDLSDPSHPTVIGDLTLSGIANGIVTMGTDHLLVAETAAGGTSGDLVVLDVSAISAPSLLSTAGLGLACAGVAIDGHVAAVATSAGLVTVDLTDLSHPGLLAIEPLVGNAFSDQYQPLGAVAVAVHDGLVWVETADLGQGLAVEFAYDLSDPRHPRHVMRTDGGATKGFAFAQEREILLGALPAEVDVSRPRNVLLSLAPPRALQR